MPPKLVYDDSCHFCTWSATFAVHRSDIVPIRLSKVQNDDTDSGLTDEERDRLPEDYDECAQLTTDEGEYSCGSAVEQALLRADVLPSGLVDALSGNAAYIGAREGFYHFLSNNRDHVSKVIHRNPPIWQS